MSKKSFAYIAGGVCITHNILWFFLNSRSVVSLRNSFFLLAHCILPEYKIQRMRGIPGKEDDERHIDGFREGGQIP